ncbi:hypothetical protein BT69DRAFT_797961 [Atractiella rhizophila]|nr:hypothetical protein BT69DRAFT_797961 [Atractiella rhizophila]
MSLEKDENFDGIQVESGQLIDSRKSNNDSSNEPAKEATVASEEEGDHRGEQATDGVGENLPDVGGRETSFEKSAALLPSALPTTVSTPAIISATNATPDSEAALRPIGGVKPSPSTSVSGGEDVQSTLSSSSQGQNSTVGGAGEQRGPSEGDSVDTACTIRKDGFTAASIDTHVTDQEAPRKQAEKEEEKNTLKSPTAASTKAETDGNSTSPTISNTSIPTHKKFTSSLNVHKKFLEKSVHAPPVVGGSGVSPGGSPNGGLVLGSASLASAKGAVVTTTGPGQARVFTTASLAPHARLVTGKISPSGSPSVQAANMATWARPQAASVPPSETSSVSPMGQPNISSARGEHIGSGRGSFPGRGGIGAYAAGRGRGAWIRVPGTDRNGIGPEAEFPTAAEAARSKFSCPPALILLTRFR